MQHLARTLPSSPVRLLVVLLVILSLALLSACETASELTNTAPAVRGAPTAVPTAPPPPQPTIAPITLQGAGQDVQPVTLPKGTYLVAVQATTKEFTHFAVNFRDTTGEPSGGGLVVNVTVEVGQQFQSKATLVIGGRLLSNQPGPQLMEVTAGATTSWQVTISST